MPGATLRQVVSRAAFRRAVTAAPLAQAVLSRVRPAACALVLLAPVVGARPVQGQSPSPSFATDSAAAYACLDSLPASTLRRAVARLSLRADSTRDTAVALAVGFLAEELGPVLRARLGGSDSTLAPADSFLTWRDLQQASVTLVLSPTGFVWRADASTPPGVVRLLAPMLDSLMTSPPQVVWPEHVEARAVHVTLTLAVPPFDREGRPVAASPAGPTVAAMGPPVFTLPHPWHAPAMAPPGALASLRYPELVRRAGIEGTLMMEFVIGRDGRVFAPSIRDVQRPRYAPGEAHLTEAYDRFRQVVIPAIAQQRYIPATIGGCTMPMLVRQGFDFGLNVR